ncbi:dihydrofolate reductase [Krasilnikoviella flava]|uniref:dihydrofolate reductase n=1 Tax=Krasilnikoviella flava TaxID=526729 RepID=A0A1T5IHX4_9MICO|nr:dihydrofolate reductase [Krasilnikoviella flava]SKC38613.1 dihydrofolate reductase [Krasilnikoviella flava]
MIGLIWAQARDAAGRPVIGAAGTIPWRVPEDFAHFKATTAGHPVVMGRRTWESLPRRPLPGRTNVVVTRRPGWSDPSTSSGGTGPVVAASVDEALALAAAAPGGDEVWVMGGGEVYAATLPLADRLVVTEIDLDVEGDAFAPDIDGGLWEVDDDPSAGSGGTGAWATSSGPGGLRHRVLTYRPTPGRDLTR